MWDAIKQALVLLGQLIPLIPKPSNPKDFPDGTPSMTDIAIAQESGAVASRAGKDAARKAQRAPSSHR